MASLRQALSNKKNALLSTGPKTPEGKAASRANSYKHGLRSAGVVLAPDQHEKYEARLEEWRPGFQKALDQPAGDQKFLYDEMVFNSILVEESRGRRFDLVEKVKERAMLHWDADRKLQAAQIAQELHEQPALTVAKLMTFLQGARWLHKEWGILQSVLENGAGLDKAHRIRMLDLLGIDRFARSNSNHIEDEIAIDIVDSTLEGFDEELFENLEILDFEDRVAAAERGFTPETSRETVLTIRYSDAAFRRFKWARNELKSASKESDASEPLEEAVVPQPAAAPVAIPGPESEEPDPEPDPDEEAEIGPKPTPSVAPNEPDGSLDKLSEKNAIDPAWNDVRYSARVVG